MTYKVECENPLLRETHVTVEDIESIPIIIYDPLITELHTVVDGLVDVDKTFTVTPQQAQLNDWTWETFRGGIRIAGKINKDYTPCSLDFWLR